MAIDLSESRRDKVAKVVEKIGGVPGDGVFKVAAIEEGKKIIADWTDGLGCNTALEVGDCIPTPRLLLNFSLHPFQCVWSIYFS